MSSHRIYSMSFASVYPLYIEKVEKKGRSKADVDQIIIWLTGFNGDQLQNRLKPESTLRRSLKTRQNSTRLGSKLPV